MADSLGDNFRLGRRIASGGRSGDVFLATTVTTGEKVALRFAKQSDEHASSDHMSKEMYLYKRFAGGKGIPKFYLQGTSGSHKFIALELLGPSLTDLLGVCDGKFTLKTVLMLADQMLELVEHVHEMDYVHRNIKPSNFCIGQGDKARQIFLINFGDALQYRCERTKEHIACAEGKALVGAPKYASLCALRGLEQSRRDDLTSLGYVLMRLLNGELPWEFPRVGRMSDRIIQKIEDLKVSTSAKELCKGHPVEFATYFEYCWGLKFDEKPDYAYLRRLFRELFDRSRYTRSSDFDWAGSDALEAFA